MHAGGRLAGKAIGMRLWDLINSEIPPMALCGLDATPSRRAGIGRRAE